MNFSLLQRSIALFLILFSNRDVHAQHYGNYLKTDTPAEIAFHKADHAKRAEPAFISSVSDFSAPAISSFSPVNACPDQNITIQGSGFTGASAVQFNGQAATFFNVENDLTITARFNITGTGTLSITSPAGTATSAQNLTIHPVVAPSITISTASLVIQSGTSVTFTANAVNEGPAPVYQWYKNSAMVGTNSNSYTDAALQNLDIIYCQLSSSASCASPVQALSNIVSMTVLFPPNAGTIQGNTELCVGSNGTLTNTSASASFFAEGMPYGGGTIAYLLQPGDPGYIFNQQQGFIAANTDQATGVSWNNGTDLSTGATATAIGSGNSNTSQIILQQGAGIYAAGICANLSLNGYNDWYLPSLQEMQILYNNRNNLGAFANFIYWTSTEVNTGSARSINFINGSTISLSKSSPAFVRAIRSLNPDSHWESSNPSIASIDPVTGAVTAHAEGSCTITYTVYNPFGNATVSRLITVHPNASLGFVTGGPAAFVCPLQNFQYTVSNVVPGNGTGTWSSSNPAVASVNQHGLVTTLDAGISEITYSILNGCGADVSASQTLRVKPFAYIGGIDGPFTLCQNQSATYTPIDLVLGDGTGSWSSSNPTVATVSNSGVVTAWSAGTTEITFTISGNSCSGSIVTGSISVQVLPNAHAGTITGASSLCLGNQTTVSTNGDPDGTWSSSNPSVASISASGQVTSLSIGSTQILYTVNSGCNAPAIADFTITVINTTAPPVISGPTNVCPYIGNGSTVTYTASSPGATGYHWQVPPNVSIISGQGTESITVSFANGFASQANKQLKVRAFSPCGQSTLSTYYLLIQSPSTPAPIIPLLDNVCAAIADNNLFLAYYITKVPGAAGYNWAAQSGTTQIIHINPPGPDDTLVVLLLSTGFSTSSLTVRAVNDCGVSNARSISIVRSNPSTPGLISGPTQICAYRDPSLTASEYSVPLQAGVETYTWNLPAGASQISGQGTNTIRFIYPAGYSGGNISVTAQNGCGISGARSLAVSTLNPGTPGIIDIIEEQSCPSRTYRYTLSNMPLNATQVNWTVPAVASIISGQGTTSIQVTYPSTGVVGVVTATGVNACGNSSVRSLTVKLEACPPLFSGHDAFTKLNRPASAALNASIFPNPVSAGESIWLQAISANQDWIEARLLDIYGKPLLSFQLIPGQKKAIRMEEKPGLYFIELRQGNQRIIRKLVQQ